MASMTANPSGRANVTETRLANLSNEAVVVSATGPWAMPFLYVDNSANGDRTYLCLFDDTSADFDADSPDFIFPVPGGFEGEVIVDFLVSADNLKVSFSDGVCAAASVGNEPADAAPTSAFHARIGLIA